jgi:hypothetical protein
MELSDEQLEQIREEARRLNVGSITLHVNAHTGHVELVVQHKQKLTEKRTAASQSE